ncbi:hypothetical protein LguiB_018217 [Lonicera macranthoides]
MLDCLFTRSVRKHIVGVFDSKHGRKCLNSRQLNSMEKHLEVFDFKAGHATEGRQFDACQFKTKMNEFLSADSGDFIRMYSEVHETFDLMGLMENLSGSIHAYGFDKPSAIQQRGIVPFCEGHDRIQQALSGILEGQQLSALISIEKVMRALGGYLGVKVHACVGGTSVHEDQRILSMFVLDEAEEALSRGFKDQSFKVWWYFDSMIFHELDILARGIDVPQLLLVINYDLPNKPENCLYRIGQSGWFEKKGVAINFVTYEEERMLLDIQKFYNVNSELIHCFGDKQCILGLAVPVALKCCTLGKEKLTVLSPILKFKSIRPSLDSVSFYLEYNAKELNVAVASSKELGLKSTLTSASIFNSCPKIFIFRSIPF